METPADDDQHDGEKLPVPLRDWVPEMPLDSADYLEGPPPKYARSSMPTRTSSVSGSADAAVNKPVVSELLALVQKLDHCLLIVRHGRTVWNDEDRMSTRTDIPLTDTGRGQAARVRDALRGGSFDRVWSSPLERARDTAAIAMSRANAPAVVVDSRLVEPDAGPFEGIAFADLEHGEHADAFAGYQDEINPVFPPGATPLEESVSAARDFLADIAASPGRHFAVSHGAFIRILASEFLGMPVSHYRRLKLDNCHAVLWKFYPEPPHQLAGWNLPPA